MRRRFLQVDVFGEAPLSGNPLAVVLDGQGLSTERMQKLSEWTNLSETTFLLPPESEEADYRVRIFSLGRELPFAGHPTLGSAHAWLASGGKPRDPARIVQECGAGLVPIRRSPAGLAFAAPPLRRSGPVEDEQLAQILSVLGLRPEQLVDAAWVDNGPGWVGLLLPDAEAVLAVRPGPGNLDVGLIGPHPTGAPCAFEVRALFSDGSGTLREDPVTGSLNASLAQWLLASGRAQAPYRVSQGTRLGRAGRVRVDQDASGTVWVGGSVFTVIEGALALPDAPD